MREILINTYNRILKTFDKQLFDKRLFDKQLFDK